MKVGNIECYGIIYKIENLINHKIYIGQTITGFDRRYPSDGKDIVKVYNYYEKRKNIASCNIHLLNSIKKYGFNNFKVYKVFDTAFSLEELNIKEKCWIDIYNTIDINYGYNNREGGNRWKVTNKTKLKISKNKIGKQLKEDNPNWRGGKVSCKCDSCGRDMEIPVWRQKKFKNYFCSKECKYQFKWYKSEETIEKLREASTKNALRGGNNPTARKVVCVTTNKIFDCITDASKYYGIPSKGGITTCCRGKQASCGRYNGIKLVWKYYD